MSLSQSNVYAAPIDGPVTLNDFRLRGQSAAPATSKSTVGLTGIVLVAALAAGAFVIFDPLGMKATHIPAVGPAPLAMATAVTAPSAPPAADMNNQLAMPVPAPALAPANTVEPEQAVTKTAPRASAPAPAARVAATRHRTRTTVIETPSSDTVTTNAAPVAKPAPVDAPSAPEAQVDSN
ncbi:MAG: hypothetical protein ABI854_04475 [Betaproteobacteria bacterium]